MLFVALLSSPGRVEATMDMAKSTRKACIMCHRTPRGAKRGRPQLKPFGLRYLTMLIKKEGYVPLNAYRKLNHLAQKIAENKAKKAEAQEAEKKKSELLSQSASSTVDATAPLDTAKTEDVEKPVQAAEKSPTAPAIDPTKPRKKLLKKTAGDKKAEKAAPKPPTSFTRSVTRPKVDAKEKKLLNEKKKEKETAKEKVQIKPGKGVRFKGGKTFILKKKPKVLDVNYDWEDDWEFDDYF